MNAVVPPLSRQHAPPAPQRLMPRASARKKRLPDFIAKRVFGKPLAPSEAEWQKVKVQS